MLAAPKEPQLWALLESQGFPQQGCLQCEGPAAHCFMEWLPSCLETPLQPPELPVQLLAGSGVTAWPLVLCSPRGQDPSKGKGQDAQGRATCLAASTDT